MSTTTIGRGRRSTLLALLLGLLLSTTGCGLIGGATGGGTKEYTAYFADSAGLFVGNDVGILGVNVGEITAIDPAGNKVKVTLEVDEDYKVPADVGAVVVARSVATDRYVELTPVYTKGPELGDGEEIPLKRTRTPVDFDQVLESLNNFATGIAGDKDTIRAVQNFINAGTKALKGRGPLLNQTIHSLAEGVNGVHAQRENVAATLRSLDVLLGTIARNEGTAREFIQQVARAADLLASERNNFRTALRSLDDAVTAVAEFAVANRDEIVKTLDGSTRLMKVVLSKQERLQEVLRVMPLSLQNLQLARAPGNRLPVVLDPVALDPLGGLLRNICDSLPAGICDLLSLDPLGRPAPTLDGGAR